MFFLVELTLEHGKCVTVAHEEYATDGLSDSHSSFQLHDGFEGDLENDEFDFGDSTTDAVCYPFSYLLDAIDDNLLTVLFYLIPS
jgi:hypothetical protein